MLSRKPYIFRLVIAAAMACGANSLLAADSARPLVLAQSIQQQEEQHRQELLRKSLQDQLKDGRSKAELAARAERLYRNLVLEQGITHEAAIEALRRAGYPTSGIRRLQ